MVGYSQELPRLAAVATALWAVLVCGRIAFKHGANVVAKISIRFSMATNPRFISAPEIERRSNEELIQRAWDFFQMTQRRRTIRDFSDRTVPREVIEHCIRAAGTAPSGANHQPWHFVAVNDPKVKHEIRVAAQAEEKEFTSIVHQKPGWMRWRRWVPTGKNRFLKLPRG